MSSSPAVLAAVGDLIRAQTMRVEITPTIAYTVRAPCLLTQLQDAIATGTERTGRTGGEGAPIATNAFDLWVEINHSTHAWARHLDLNRKDPTDGNPTPWIGRLLRSAAATAHSKGLEPITDRITLSATTWANRIREMLTGDVDQRAIYGAHCPQCDSKAVTEDRPGEGRVNVPAIIVVTYETLRWVVCRGCGHSEPLVHPDAAELVHVSDAIHPEGDAA